MARLPEPGGDNGVWGFILNEFLEVEHLPDGRHHSASSSQRGVLYLRRDLGNSASQPNVVGLQGRDLAGTAPLNAQVIMWNNGNNRWQPSDIPSATTTSSGIVQLTNDFTGTSTSPTVSGIQNRSVANTAPTNGQALAWNNTSSQWEPTTISGGGANYPFVVAAVDSPAEWQNIAHAVCAGTGDEVTIQSVIDDAATAGVGGEVIVAPGSYNVTVAASSYAINIPTGVKLRGAGPQYSVIYMENGADPGVGSEVIQIGVNASIEGLYVGSYFSTRAVRIRDAGGRNRIADCYLESDYACVYGLNSVRIWLERNQIECGGNNEAAVIFEGNSLNIWVKENFIRGGAIGINVDGSAPGAAPGQITIVDNHIEQNGYQGILLNDIDPGIGFTKVTGNIIDAQGVVAVGTDNFGAIEVVGNPAVDTIDTASLSEETVLIISENIIESTNQGHGILLNGATGTQLLNNNIEEPGEHGIYLTGSTDVDISENQIKWTMGPGPSYDGIHIADASNRNRLLGNKIIDDATSGSPNPFRYGINIATADCNDNIIENNDLSLTGTGTGILNDAGTNTKIGPNNEWDLGLPSARTDGHVVTWDDTSQTFQLAAGGGGSGGGGEPTIFVAASDAIPEEQAKADYVCTGTDDHVTINTALNDIFPSPNQGRLVLSAGSFYINPMEVDISDRVHLHGMGSERTFIRNQTDGASGQWLIRAQTDSEISNIGFITTSTYAGTVIASDYTRLENVTHLGGGAEIGIHITGAQQPMSDLVVNGAYTNAGILVDEGWVALSNVVSLRSDTAGGACIRFSSSAAQVSTISNCVISYNVSGAGDGIALDGGEIQINNVAIRTIGMSAIILEDTAPFQLSINNAHLEAAYGIRSTGPFPSIDEAIFSNLIIDATASGIDMSNVRRSKFHNITVVQPGEHGIRLTTSNDNTIDGCYVYRPGALLTNTYDGIVLEGDSNRNMITNSKVDPRPTGNTTRYGINIAAATCDDNIVVGNDLRPVATYGSGALNDAGTGTINTYPGGAAGDNFI